MDDLLIYLLLGIIYLVYSGLTSKKKKKKKKPAPPLAGPPMSAPAGSPVNTTSAAEPTLDDALREIRIALGMEPPPAPPSRPTPSPPRATPPPIQPPPRKTTPPTRSHGPSLAETAPQKSWPSEFKAIPTHYADSDFEELRTRDGDRFGQRPKTSKPSPTPAAKAPLKLLSKKQASTGVRRSSIQQQLKDPNAAREAFILSEIFGPPHANRRR